MNIDYRINYFKQIKDFYSLIFNTDYDIRPVHISLYMFLLNQNNRNNWVEWFKCPFDLAMAGSCINSKSTYYKVLDDLKTFGLIEYEKGINLFKAPKIKILPLNNVCSVLNNSTLSEQVTVPLSEQVTVQATEQLSVQLNEHIYKLITDNLKLINDNKESFFDFIKVLKGEEVKDKKNKFTPPPQIDVVNYFVENGYKQEVAIKAWNYYETGKWKDGSGKQVKNWKQKMQSV